MSDTLKIECAFHVQKQHRGRKKVEAGEQPPPPCEPGRVLRVARWLALAHHFEELLRQGLVKDYAEIAALMQVTRARVSQVMNLLLLAPDLQEELLCWPRILKGRNPVRLCDLQPIALTPDWKKQRWLWQQLSQVYRAEE